MHDDLAFFFFLSRFASMRKDSIDVIVRNEYYKLQSTVGIRPKKIVLCFKTLLRQTKKHGFVPMSKIGFKIDLNMMMAPKIPTKTGFY